MTRSQEIYFCDNPKRLSCLELRDIPAFKREAIRRLHCLEDSHNVRLLFFLVIWAVAGYAVLTRDHVAVQVASCLIEVSAFIGCTVLLHEASHGLLFKYPALNRLAGLLCGLLVLLTVSGFWTNHKMHHARRGSTMPARGGDRGLVERWRAGRALRRWADRERTDGALPRGLPVPVEATAPTRSR